jgi:hypothetical protein
VCATQAAFHVTLQDSYPNVVLHAFEVYFEPDNRPLMEALAAAYGRSVSGVPMTFIGDETWTGFSQVVAQQMVAAVERYSAYNAPNPIDRVDPSFRRLLAPAEPSPDRAPATANRAPALIEVPLVGVIDLRGRELWLATGLIAFVDGFNPCSLWVLALLLAVVVNTRSRKRVLLVGFTFLLVTALAYGTFIAGLFTIFSFIGFLDGIRVAVAVLALGFIGLLRRRPLWFALGGLPTGMILIHALVTHAIPRYTRPAAGAMLLAVAIASVLAVERGWAAFRSRRRGGDARPSATAAPTPRS